VNIAMAELAANLKEGLLALAVGAGLQVMQVLIEESVTAVAGPKGRHDPNRAAVRHGTDAGAVTQGGRRVGDAELTELDLVALMIDGGVSASSSSS
jgi:putative transposase